MKDGGEELEDLFEFTGQTAIILMVTAGITGILGSQLRRIIKGPWVYRVHKWSGIGALVSGIMHGLIYSIFLG